jgi:hypothetical protein
MQTDGNLVLYAPGGVPIWSSRTYGHAGAALHVQDDCNVVLSAPSGTVLWSSSTHCP